MKAIHRPTPAPAAMKLSIKEGKQFSAFDIKNGRKMNGSKKKKKWCRMRIVETKSTQWTDHHPWMKPSPLWIEYSRFTLHSLPFVSETIACKRGRTHCRMELAAKCDWLNKNDVKIFLIYDISAIFIVAIPMAFIWQSFFFSPFYIWFGIDVTHNFASSHFLLNYISPAEWSQHSSYSYIFF